MGEAIKTRRGEGKSVGLRYYIEGDEFQTTTGGWVVGSSNSSGNQSKEIDHLYFSDIYGTGAAWRTYVTDRKVDLTNVNKLVFDWEKSQSDYADSRFYVRITSSKTGKAIDSDFVASLDSGYRGTFQRETQELDVSGITGEWHIRVHGYSASQLFSGRFTGKVYRIWGE